LYKPAGTFLETLASKIRQGGYLMLRKKIQVIAVLLIGLCLVCSSVGAADWSPDADLVLYNGKILTVDKNFSTVEAVAIKNGIFIAAGSKNEALKYAGNQTRKIDLNGKTVIPGLIDSHNHMMRTGVSFLKDVQLYHCEAMSDVLEAIGQRARELGPGKWVVTSGQWHESQLREKRLPNREELDSVAPDNPVYVARGGHTTVVNSKAFEIAGITKETADPPGGEFKRDPVTGELTGLLFERPAQSMIQKHIPPTTYDEVIDGLRYVLRKYNEYGIVGVSEPGFYVGPSSFTPYYVLWKNNELTVRTRLMIRAWKPEDAKSATEYLHQGFGDDILKVSGIKMLLDGGVETALLNEPYEIVHGEQEKENYHGVQVISTENLKGVCKIAAENGWHVETHAVGDAAIDLLVNTYAEINRTIPIKDLRWTVMHIFLPTQDALDKMKECGIWCTAQDHPTYLGANQVKYWGQERGTYAIPLRKLVDEGFIVGGGSDSNVVNFDPYLSLWWMVTRKTVTAGTLGPDQKVSREEALRMYTINNAYFTFEEDVRGSIELGKWADLVVLDRDYMNCPEDEIREMRPVMTVVGGKIVYEK